MYDYVAADAGDVRSALMGPFFEPVGVKSVMKVVPIGNKAVIRRLDAEETTAGGIVLPEAAREKPKQGRVLSVGDGILLKDGSRAAMDVKEGDRVLFSSYAGTEVTVDDQELLIMSAEEILAVVG